MSALILRAYYRQLTGQDIGIDRQVEDVQLFYTNANNPEWIKTQNELYWTNYMKKFNLGDTLATHIYYNRNWLGMPKNNVIIEAVILEKKDNELKINIVSFGGEDEKKTVFDEIKCKEGDCWVNPHDWKPRQKQ